MCCSVGSWPGQKQPLGVGGCPQTHGSHRELVFARPSKGQQGTADLPGDPISPNPNLPTGQVVPTSSHGGDKPLSGLVGGVSPPSPKDDRAFLQPLPTAPPPTPLLSGAQWLREHLPAREHSTTRAPGGCGVVTGTVSAVSNHTVPRLPREQPRRAGNVLLSVLLGARLHRGKLRASWAPGGGVGRGWAVSELGKGR